ncbi:hypothetical protein LZ30DRAFT_259495 [Colletotrichum cereale]|nr:hypothetical protein LZ30DRAFT_259495 [Colletotrichum cereale]
MTVAEEPKSQQLPLPQKSDAFSFGRNSIFTLAPYTNNRFDRNEAWDTPKDTVAVTHRSLLPLQTPGPSKRRGGRPFAAHQMKRTIEDYEPTVASATANTPLQQDIRDGFDEEETVLPSKQHSAKRRKRSPPPLGMGSLSVTVGSKPTTPRRVTKRIGIRQNFLVDPDLDPDNNTAKGQPRKVSAEFGVPTTSDYAEHVAHHIIPSIETAMMYNNNENRAVLPPLRPHDSIRQTGGQRYDFGSLDTISSFLGSDTHATASFRCGSCSRPGSTDSNAFETLSLDASHFWASSISRASSETNQLFDSRESSSTNDDETQWRSGAGTSFFSIMAAEESPTDRLAWIRSKSHSRKSLVKPENDRKIYAYGKAQTTLSPTTRSWQSVQGRFTTWTGAMGDLGPRPPGVSFQG